MAYVLNANILSTCSYTLSCSVTCLASVSASYIVASASKKFLGLVIGLTLSGPLFLASASAWASCPAGLFNIPVREAMLCYFHQISLHEICFSQGTMMKFIRYKGSASIQYKTYNTIYGKIKILEIKNDNIFQVWCRLQEQNIVYVYVKFLWDSFL